MKSQLLLAAWIIIFIAAGCRAIPIGGSTPTPPPGWRSLVSNLLVEDDVFPEGWARIRDLPAESLTNPTINHVYRSWWGKAWGVGKADQAIWRAYTIGNAQCKYNEILQQPMFRPENYTPSPWNFYIEFKPPPEIVFKSQLADEFSLVCGWWDKAECHVITRYRNYVTFVSFDLEAEYEGHISHGLTYAEIEAVVQAMDAKFAEAMEEWYPASP